MEMINYWDVREKAIEITKQESQDLEKKEFMQNLMRKYFDINPINWRFNTAKEYLFTHHLEECFTKQASNKSKYSFRYVLNKKGEIYINVIKGQINYSNRWGHIETHSRLDIE